MTRLRPTLAAVFAALLLAAPTAAAGRPSHMTAVELARAQERAYMQQANADPLPPRTATPADGGVSAALLAGSIAAGLLLAATSGLAAIAVHRRHARAASASVRT
jgi:2-hydroxychromene-2-carboxylate isomerase